MATKNDQYGGPSTGTGFGGSTQASKSNISGLANATSEQLVDVAGQAQQAAQDQFDRLADAIRRKPIQATGIAAGVGFLLAFIARR